MTTDTKMHAAQTTAPMMEFPAGLPKPHQSRDWGRLLESNVTARGLTDVAREQLPKGLFEKLWSAEALQDPPLLPEGAPFGDQMRWRALRDTVEKRLNDNQRTKEQREDWWTKKNHEYFLLVTDSMKRTAPGLRDLLVDRFLVTDGYYDGVAAMKYVEAWLKAIERRHPQHKFYQTCLDTLMSKRLPTGPGGLPVSVSPSTLNTLLYGRGHPCGSTVVIANSSCAALMPNRLWSRLAAASPANARS